MLAPQDFTKSTLAKFLSKLIFLLDLVDVLELLVVVHTESAPVLDCTLRLGLSPPPRVADPIKQRGHLLTIISKLYSPRGGIGSNAASFTLAPCEEVRGSLLLPAEEVIIFALGQGVRVRRGALARSHEHIGRATPAVSKGQGTVVLQVEVLLLALLLPVVVAWGRRPAEVRYQFGPGCWSLLRHFVQISLRRFQQVFEELGWSLG